MTQHYQCDVAIVGGGIAGVTAALELIAAGKSVAIFESEGPQRFGGSALEAFGGLFFVDSPEQRRGRIVDTPERALKDWESFAQFGPDEVWPRRWAAHLVERATPDARDYLHAKGLSWLPVVLWVERGLEVAGNSVPRFHLSWGTGRRVVTQIIDALQSHENVRRLATHFHHRVERIETNGGRITGLSGRNPATDFTVDAGVVIVAAGGIGGNLAQVRKYWDPGGAPQPETILLGTHPSSDGRLLEASQEIGAQLTHVGRMWNYAGGVRHPKPDWPDHGVSLVPPKSALWVDATGKRLTPPIVSGFDTHEMVRRVALAPHGYTWQIMNKRIALKELAASGAVWNPAVRERRFLRFVLDTLLGNSWLYDELTMKSPDFVMAPTVGALVERMNAMNNPARVDARALEDEIKTFDATLSASSSIDPQRRQIETLREYRGDRLRLAKRVALLDKRAGPLIAIREHVVTRKSLGGIVTDLQSRALGANGEPIAGLYAIGESAGFGGGGSHGWRGLEGTFLLSSIITARRAAESVSR